MNRLAILVLTFLIAGEGALSADERNTDLLSWTELPRLPDELGVAGPFAGVHNDALIVAGGA